MQDNPPDRAPASKCEVELLLDYNPPMDWESLLDYYRAHQIGGVESVNQLGYERLFVEDGEVSLLRVTHDDNKNPQLKLRINGNKPTSFPAIVGRIRRMFDLDMNPSLVESAFRRQKSFGAVYFWKHFHSEPPAQAKESK